MIQSILGKTVILLSFVRGVCSGGRADEDDGITGCLSLVMLIFSCSHPRLRVFKKASQQSRCSSSHNSESFATTPRLTAV